MWRKMTAILMAFMLVLTMAVLSVSPSFAVSAADAKAQARAYQKHSLGLTSVKNARDLGGYKTKDGRTVKFGKLLRSGKPTDLSKADRKKLVHQYKLKKVIDFRDRAEILIDGEDTKLPGVTYYNFSYSMTPVNSWLRSTAGLDHLSYQLETLIAQDFDGNLISAYYGVGYRSMYLTEDGIALFRNFFRELLDANGDTVLFHCSSGKDRAGNAAMLLLSALGVDKKTIIEDYMLTNDYFAEDRKELYDLACRIVPDKSIAKDISYLLGVRRSYIENSYRSIETHYGSVDGFLKKGLGLTNKDLKKLQKAYLQ